MHQLYKFREVIDHVTSGGRAYLVTEQGPLNYIKGTANGVMWGQEGSSHMIDCPLKHCIWGARYVIFAGVKPVSITSYQNYTCIKATNNITTLFTVFDDGKKVHSGEETLGEFNLEEWVDALSTPF